MFIPSSINLRKLQQQLFSVVYKMIGEVAASEDIVQDTLTTFLTKQQQKALHHVQDLQKYLIKTATHKSINYLKKIKKQRENYYGVWLPEPVFHPTQQIDAQIDLDYGLTFLLGHFTPKERAVFILKHAFDLTFKEIGELLELKEATCRKIFQRLNNKLPQPTTEKNIHKTLKKQLIQAFLAVEQEKGIEQLIALLKEDIILYSDGGGKRVAAKIPLVGKRVCSKFLLGIFKKFGNQLVASYLIINEMPALQLNTINGDIDTVVYFTLLEGQINTIYMIRNPDKLIPRN